MVADVFFNLSPSSTEMDKRIAFLSMLKQAEYEVLNGLKCMHRDPETGTIHTDHPSSTGLYRMRWY